MGFVDGCYGFDCFKLYDQTRINQQVKAKRFLKDHALVSMGIST